jgi:hypothetical protein
MADQKTFANGLICKRRDNAPEFVVANLSVKVDEFVAFLQEHQDKGWVNIDMCVSRGGKMYASLDTWKPTQGAAAEQGMAQAKAAAAPVPDDDIPF